MTGTSKPSLDISALGATPERAIEHPQNDLYSASREVVEAYQIAALRTRLNDLRDKIPIVKKLANENDVVDIRRVEDIAPLLLPHSDYKSYPTSILETGRYDRLTKWLDNFTVHDLSQIDASACESLDDWVTLLDEKTDIRLVTSSGTTGKVSFLPRSEKEGPLFAFGWRRNSEGFADEPRVNHDAESYPVLNPTFKSGMLNTKRVKHNLVTYLFGGDESSFIEINPQVMSLDAASLAGRMRTAQAKGELGQQQLSPKLLANRDELLRGQSNFEQYVDRFFSETLPGLRNRPIVVMGSWALAYDLVTEGQKRGVTKMFHPDTIFNCAGGTKGRDLPDNYRDIVLDLSGARSIRPCYGMQEILSTSRVCSHGYHHVYPYFVPFVLDPATGAQFPRTGEHKGRCGVFDLNASTYWGGFLTGDEVTLNWGDKNPCACGRIGPYIHPTIRRYSEKEAGGDDKITCAGAPEAHDKAMDFLKNL